MSYFIAGCMNVIRVESVNRSEPNIGALAPLLRCSAFRRSPTMMTSRGQRPHDRKSNCKGENAMSKSKHKSRPEPALPAIKITTDEPRL
jgi:hypothetical protein